LVEVGGEAADARDDGDRRGIEVGAHGAPFRAHAVDVVAAA
jgi:hypothetical protein